MNQVVEVVVGRDPIEMEATDPEDDLFVCFESSGPDSTSGWHALQCYSLSRDSDAG